MLLKTKFAVVGCGRIGKRHASMVKINAETELVALIDIDESLKPSLQKEFNVPFFTTMDDFINSKIETDVINVCTPNYLHASQAIIALKNNAHVVIEKPLALSRVDAEEVIHESLKVNKRVFCVMQNRYSPPSKWLKEVVESGVLGKVYMANINCFWNRDDDYYQGGNPAYWKGKLDKDGAIQSFCRYDVLVVW